MDKKRLTPGDWAMIKSWPMTFQPTRFENGHWVRSLCEFEPIQLTSEMLKLNGGKEEHDTDSTGADYEDWSFDGFDFNKLNCTAADGGFQFSIACEDSDDTLYKKCAYVHELQQALRLMGYNEFADNFKIS